MLCFDIDPTMTMIIRLMMPMNDDTLSEVQVLLICSTDFTYSSWQNANPVVMDGDEADAADLY